MIDNVEIVVITMLCIAVVALLFVYVLLVRFYKRYSLVRKTNWSEKCLDHEHYSLKIKHLSVLSDAVECLKCGDTVSGKDQTGTAFCGCKNVFVDSSPTHLAVGAKDFAQVRDNTLVTVATMRVDK